MNLTDNFINRDKLVCKSLSDNVVKALSDIAYRV